ncbi:hypothetical protein N665_0226s0038 [Sinapis alba]|nr:hypothetical protein N665_0226s0038 [Sinapis alba]
MDLSSLPFQGTVNRDANDVEEEFYTPESDRRGKQKQSAEYSQEQSKTKCILPTRSDVWAHYQISEENCDKCVCNYCLKIFTCPTKSRTTNLCNHINSCKQFKSCKHNISYERFFKSAKISKDVFIQAANEMLIIGHMSLSFVESVAFKHFCNKIILIMYLLKF